MSPKAADALVRKRSTRKMAPEDMASSIRHANALIPHQRALEDKLLGPLTANHGSPFGNHHGASASSSSGATGAMDGSSSGDGQGGQSGNPFPSLSFGLGLGPGASAGLGMFPAKPTRRDVPPATPTSGQQPDSSSPLTATTTSIVTPQSGTTTTMAAGTGTGKPLNFIPYRRSSSAPPAPPVIATLYPPGTTTSTIGDQQQAAAASPVQPTQLPPPQQRQQSTAPRSPAKGQGQAHASGGIGAQRRHHQPANSTGSNAAAPYARPVGPSSRRMVGPGSVGVGPGVAGDAHASVKAGRPAPRLIMPFDIPTAPIVPPIGSTHTSRAGTPMSAPVMPSHMAHHHPHHHHQPHPFARQEQDEGEDKDAQEVLAHLEEMRRVRGEQMPLFDPGYSFPTTTTATANVGAGAPSASSHHQETMPRPNGSMGGRAMVGRRYDPPAYPPPMDDAAYQQQQALFGSHVQPHHSQHQPTHPHQHHEQPQPQQQHFTPPPPPQDYWTAHPDGTYINGHVGVNGLDEFSAMGTDMDLDAMVLDHATFDAQQMQLRQAFEQSQQQHHFEAAGDYVPSPISASFDPATGHPAPYPQHQQRQEIEFPQDYSMAVPVPPQHQHPSPAKLPARPLARRSATAGPSITITGSPSSSVSTAPAHTPPAGGALPLRLPTPSNHSNLAPASSIRPGTETFFDWTAVPSPLPPHPRHPDAPPGGPDDPSSLQMPPPHSLDELSRHPAPMPEIEMKFDFNATMHHHPNQEGHHDTASHPHPHGPLDVDPLSQLGLPPLSPHHPSQTGLHNHDPYGSDAFPQTHRPSMYGFNSNFDAGFVAQAASPPATTAYHQHPSAPGAVPPSGSWTGGFGFGSLSSGSMSGAPGFGPASSTGLGGAVGSSSGATGMNTGGLASGVGGGLAGRRLSRRASSLWLSRASLAGDLAGVGLGEF